MKLDMSNIYFGLPVILTFFAATIGILLNADRVTLALVCIQMICIRLMFERTK